MDIGSNDGTWLRQYAPFGCRVLGVEAAANVAKLANEAGLRTWNRFFDEGCAKDILASEGRAKVVTAAGVFFHLEDLHSVVAGIASLLADDGVFVVQAIYLGGMIENVAFDQIYHEHLCYYTLKSLSNLVKPYGLEVFFTRMVPIHGGTIEAHIARAGVHPIDESVENLARKRTTRSSTALRLIDVSLPACSIFGSARWSSGVASAIRAYHMGLWRSPQRARRY